MKLLKPTYLLRTLLLLCAVAVVSSACERNENCSRCRTNWTHMIANRQVYDCQKEQRIAELPASVERERPDSRPGVRDQRQAVRRIPQVQTRLGHPLHGAQRPAGASSGRPPQGLSFGNPPGGTLLVDGHVHRGEADAGLDRPPVGAPRHAGDLLQGLQPFLPAIRGFQRTETLPRAGGTLSGFGDHVCRHGFGALQARPALPDEPAATSRTKWRSGCSGF